MRGALKNDEIGGFLGFTIPNGDSTFELIAVQAHSEQIRKLMIGEVDFKTVFMNLTKYGWYTSHTDDVDRTMRFQSHYDQPLPTEFMPNEGVFVDYRPDSKYDAQSVAQELNNFATVLRIEPKNALASDRLDLDTFESLISKFRKVVNSSATRYYDKNKKNQAATVKFDITSTIRPGSLVLTLLAQDQEAGMDIFNPYRNLHRALEYVATESPKLTENPGERIASYESRFLGNMLGLYKTIGENDVDVTYSWSDPRLLSCGHGAVSSESANTVVAYVDSNEEHVQEETEELITGIFTMVNLETSR